MTAENTQTILLVEDEAIIAMSEQGILKRYGFQVIIAHSGEEAIARVDEEPGIDLILMDIDLGSGIDGTEAAQTILSRHDLPLVFLSSHTEREVVEKTEGITSYGYIVKNSGETVMIASIRMAFRLFEAKLKELEREAALQESEQRYRRIYEHVAIGIAHVSLDFVIESANDAYCHMLGYSCNELAGTHLKAITHPEMLEKNLQKQQLLKQGELDHFRMEKAFIHKDGHTVYGILDASLIRDEDGTPLYFIGTVLDITRRKEYEEKLKTSDRIFEHSIDMLCIAGFDGYFKVLNPAWERTLGWSTEELLSKPWLEFVHPEDADSTDSERSVLIDGQKVYRFENRFICKNGEVRWLAWNSFPYPEENIIFGVARDITAMKENEAKLQAETARLAVTLESIGDGVITTDTEGRVTLLNPVAARLCGWQPEEAAGKKLEDILVIVNADTREEVTNPVKKVLAEGVTVGLANHTILVSKDKTEYQIADSAAPIRNREGEIIGVVLVFRDVTEEYAIQQTLQENAREMAQAQQMASLGSWCFHLDTGTVSASDETRALYGVARGGDLTIRDIQTIPLPQYREALDKKMKELIQNGRPYDIEFEIKRPADGGIRTIHSMAEYDRENNRIIGTIQDITRQKQIESELCEEHRLLETIMDTSPIGIAVVDAAGKITYANSRAETILGLSRDTIVGRDYDQPVWKATDMDGSPFPREKHPYFLVRRTGESVYDIRHHITWPDGSKRFLSVNGSPLVDEAGEFTGMVATFQDISAKEQATGAGIDASASSNYM